MPKIHLPAFMLAYRGPAPSGGPEVARSLGGVVRLVVELCWRWLVFAATVGALFALLCAALGLVS